MPIDLSSLSNDQLTALYQSQQGVHQQESRGVSDSSTITNPNSGAFGSMQVMPQTQTSPGFGVTPSNGTPEDTAREGRDYYASMYQKYGSLSDADMAYNWGPGNMDKWIAGGRDMSKLPTETLKYAHDQQVRRNSMSADSIANTKVAPGGVQPELSKLSDDQLKALYNVQKGQGTTPTGNATKNLKGLGLQAANFLGGAVEAPFIAVSTLLHGAENMYNGQGASEALGNAVKSGAEEFQMFSPENLLNKAGVQTEQLHGTTGYDIPAKAFDFMFDKGPRMLAPLLAQGIAGTGTGLSELPVKPQDIEDVTHLEQGIMLASPAAELFRGKGGAEVPQDLQTKLATGKIDDPSVPPEQMGPEYPAGIASPYEPNRLSEDVVSPWSPDRNLRQMSLDFEQPEQFPELRATGAVSSPLKGIPDSAFNGDLADRLDATFSSPDFAGDRVPLANMGFTPDEITALQNAGLADVDGTMSRQQWAQWDKERGNRVSGKRSYPEDQPASTNDVGTPQQIEEARPFRDEMAQRVEEFNRTEPEQMDMFNEIQQRRFDQFGPDEQPRALTSEEFEGTLRNLSEQEGTRFDMPENVDEAYGKYLDTVRDDQGGLFDRPSIAKNFADLAKQESIDRFLDNHPIIKAAEAKIANLEQLVASNPDSQTRSWAARDLQNALDTMERARENLGKQYKDTGLHPYERDGIVYMNMGVPIPDWIKNGLVKMLQGLHGAVFKFLNNRMKGPDKVNSFGKIVGKGIKDFVNKEANRDWQVKKNESAVDKIQAGPLGKFDAIKEWIPDDRPYPEVKQDMVNAPDMDSTWITKNITSQGGLWASVISKSPIAKWAFTKVNAAIKRVESESKRLLTDKDSGLRTFMQSMDSREKGEIHALMDMNEGERVFTENELRGRGFNQKQIAYYKRFQEVMGEVLNKFNDGLQKAGLPPVEARTAYMTSRFMGDFRAMVYQKGTKNPVGFVGHNSRFALNQIIKHIDEQNPGKYDFEKPTLNRGPNRASPDMFQGYLNVIRHFELNDPEMKQIMDTYRQYFTNNSAKALQALQHAKDKRGVMGAEGRKAWLDQEQNAAEGMKSQLTYAEHMIRWSEMQDASSQIKEMLTDTDLDNKPNAKSYVTDYLANAMGQNKAPLNLALSSIMDGVSEMTGFGPSIWRKLNNGQKSALLQMWLGFLRIPHSVLTMTQFFQSNPAFAQLMHSRGVDVGFWGNTMKGVNTAIKIGLKSLGKNIELTGIDKAIYEYNQKNGVFSVNLKSHLTDVNDSSAKRTFDKITEANITYPEAALRSTTFSIWTHALTEAGMPLNEALGTAENLTRGALVDYRPSERPLVFGKMGFLGDIASTLTRFKMNQISQHQYFAKEIGQTGSVMPMATLLLSSVAFAGLSGVLGFNYADELYHGISYLMGKPDRLKAMMLRNLPDFANYGLLSQLGINMQGSFSNADTIPDNPWAALFPTASTLGSMVKSVGEAAYYHDAATAKKLAYNFLPTSLKGIAENQFFSKDVGNGNKAFFNPNQGNELQSIRTPGEQVARDLAFHPFQESRDADVRRFAKEAQSDYADLRNKDLTRYTNKLATGTISQSDLDTLRKDWIAHRGDPNQLATSLESFYKGRALTANQREIGIPQSLGDIYKFQDITSMKGSRK